MAEKTLFDKLKSESSLKTKKSNTVFKLVISLLTIVLCTYFFILRIAEVENTEHKPALGLSWYGDDIIAEYSFPVLRKKSELIQAQETAKENSRKVFTFNPFEQQNSLTKTDRFFQKYISDTTLNQITISKVYSKFRSIINDIYSNGYINIDLNEINNSEILLESPDGERLIIKKTKIYDIAKIRNRISNEFQNTTFDGENNINFEISLINTFKANYEFSESFTDENKQRNLQSVPKTNGFVKKGDVIIAKNTIVTEDDLRILDSYYSNKYTTNTGGDRLFIYIGTIGHVLIILAFLFIYIFKITDAEYFDNLKITLICLFIILITWMAWLSLALEFTYPVEYLIILPGISILATIIFETRTAFYLTITLAFLVAGMRGNDYSTGVMMLFSGFMAIFSVRDIQSRGQLFKSILFVFIGFSLPILFFGLESNLEYSELITRLGFASINAAISPLIAFGLLFVIEQFTYINTNLSLQEYDNLNHPLLQQLNEIAPGTYQHSLGVSALSERCAGSIGANTLFCKVAPYYHDIGKMEKPEYFAENQIGIENKHNLISPHQSAQIIKNHVTAGAKLARKYKLPRNIIDVINMHHGTTLIQHFYAKAVELSQDDNVDKSDFSYPGPKPNSRETAIIMICDQAEAISRIENKSKEEFEIMIDGIIKSMLEQHQFDECELTTNDLNIISAILKKQLAGVSHKRVDYKKISND